MVAELRKRKAPREKAEAAPVKAATKSAATTPKVEKRKAAEDASPIVVKKQKQGKSAKAEKQTAPSKTKGAKTSKAKAQEEPVPDVEDVDGAEAEEDARNEEEDVEEETQALVRAIDNGEDDEDGDEEGEDQYQEGQDVGKIPKVTDKVKKSVTANGSKTGKGVVYIGHLPMGFFEHELRGYFSQFGPISRLRVSRNRKTGAAKHYAFIEFQEASTADIVAATMNSYLLFGRVLRVSVVQPDQVHENLWKGANRRFKKVPWAKIEAGKLAQPLTETGWASRNSKEEARRLKRAEKLKAMGYEFEGPKLKAAEAKAAPALEDPEDAPTLAIEEAPAEEPVEVVVEQVEAETAEEVPAEDVTEASTAKPKKGKAAGKKGAAKGKKSKA